MNTIPLFVPSGYRHHFVSAVCYRVGATSVLWRRKCASVNISSTPPAGLFFASKSSHVFRFTFNFPCDLLTVCPGMIDAGFSMIPSHVWTKSHGSTKGPSVSVETGDSALAGRKCMMFRASLQCGISEEYLRHTACHLTSRWSKLTTA